MDASLLPFRVGLLGTRAQGVGRGGSDCSNHFLIHVERGEGGKGRDTAIHDIDGACFVMAG